MAPHIYFDASALAKKYAPEPGSGLLDRIFQKVSQGRLMCLTLGTLEVISIFVRKKNARRLSGQAFSQALVDFRTEVADAAAVTKLTATDLLLQRSAPIIEKHSLNASDAILLQSALDVATTLKNNGDDLILVASDQRLLRAAQAESLQTFDPENQDQAALDVLLGP